MSIFKISALCLGVLFCFLSPAGFFHGKTACFALPQMEGDADSCTLPLDENHSISMTSFLEFASQCLKLSLLYDEDNVAQHRYQFTKPFSVPRSKFQGFFERLLLDKGFIYLKFGEDPSAIHRVLKIQDRRNETFPLRSATTFLTLEELETYRERGTLVTISIPLKNLDARNLMTSLTPFFPNQVLEYIRPVERANSIILTANAQKVWQIAKLVRKMDTGSQYKVSEDIHQKMARLERSIEALEKKIKALEMEKNQ